jgi:hypothetical protein
MGSSERVRTARRAVRLSACVEATGVQTKTRDAPVNFDDIGHDMMTIVISSLSNIATKPRSDAVDPEPTAVVWMKRKAMAGGNA